MVAAEVHEISAAFLDLGTLVARQADDVHRATTLADEATADVAMGRAREELHSCSSWSASSKGGAARCSDS